MKRSRWSTPVKCLWLQELILSKLFQYILYKCIYRVSDSENEILMVVYTLPVPAVDTLVQLSDHKPFVGLYILLYILYVQGLYGHGKPGKGMEFSNGTRD